MFKKTQTGIFSIPSFAGRLPPVRFQNHAARSVSIKSAFSLMQMENGKSQGISDGNLIYFTKARTKH